MATANPTQLTIDFETPKGRRPSVVTCGHPDRRHKGHGLCEQCYNRSRVESGASREANRKHEAKYPERRRANGKRYREAHREKVLAKLRKWYAENRDHALEYAKLRDRKLRATEDGRRRLRTWEFKTKFGLSEDGYLAIHDAQEGRCAICHQPETAKRAGFLKWLAVDHDHKTGKIRGLLCQACNTMIGQARESVEVLQAAIAYLGRTG